MLKNPKIPYYFQYALLAYILIWILYHVATIFQSDYYEYLSFGISDWLINYQGGFVRRGLAGEILYHIFKIHPYPVATVIVVFDAIAISGFVCLMLYICHKMQWSAIAALFPLLICNTVKFDIIGYRRDFLMMLIIYGIFWLFFNLLKNNRWWKYTLWTIIVGIAILLYEPVFFLIVPISAVLVFVSSKGTLCSKLCKAIGFIMIPVVVMGMVCLYQGTQGQSSLIWHSWKTLFDLYPLDPSYDGTMLGYGVKYLDMDTSTQMVKVLKRNFGFMTFNAISTELLLAIAFVFVYIIVTKVPKLNHSTKSLSVNGLEKSLSNVLLIQFIGMLPMFTVLSWDFGRTIPYCIYTTFMIVYIGGDLLQNTVNDIPLISRVSNKVQSFMDNSVCNSFTFYILLLMLTPLRFCYAFKWYDAIIVQQIQHYLGCYE